MSTISFIDHPEAWFNQVFEQGTNPIHDLLKNILPHHQPSRYERIRDEILHFPYGNMCTSIQERLGMNPQTMRTMVESFGALIAAYIFAKITRNNPDLNELILCLTFFIGIMALIRLMHRESQAPSIVQNPLR